jgi:alpha-L-fucosidase
LTPVYYIPPNFPTLLMPTANEILVVNQPPLGCIPAMLTLYGGPKANYDGHGCLSDLNKISAAHNKLLGDRVVALRAKHPTAKIYYGDAHGVYTDILKDLKRYSKWLTKAPNSQDCVCVSAESE